jgi:hypothetical protein
VRVGHPALLVLLALVLAASACGGEEPRAALLPAGAPPAQVVRAYVGALDRGDRDALRELSTEHYADRAAGWLPNLEGIRLLRAERVLLDVDGVGSSRRHPEVVHVLVQLDLDLADPAASGFATDGPTPWGYILVRDAPGDPWRIDDEGRI